MKKWLLAAAAAVALSAAAGAASASVIVLDFEGVGNLAAVNNFYNGGTDSLGNSGTNFGVTFSGPTLGIIDSDAGGSGNIANEPSPSTAMFFLDANNAILNFAAGFTTGFSFFYTSSTAASVDVFDDLNGTGNLLGTLNLNAQFSDNCVGDPSGSFCNWTAVGVGFGGTAKSINFNGSANHTAFDNITFGSATAGGGAPEPAAWALMLSGFGLAGAALRRRRSAAVAA